MSYTNGIGNLQHSSIEPQVRTETIVKPQLEKSASAASRTAIVAASRPAPAKDEANLSTASTGLAQALSVSDVRSEKVASLQQAIASGSYTVSSADVADKLLHVLLS